MRLLCRAVVLALLAAPLVSAETKELRVSASLAFGGVSREGCWSAVRFEIDNPLADEQRLALAVPGHAGRAVRDVVVPSGSRQAYWLPVRVERTMEWSAVTDKGKVIHDTIRASIQGPGVRLFLVPGESSLGLPDTNELWKAVLVPAEELPDFSDAYEAFDAVVLRFPCVGLKEEAAEAIRRWTLAGGVTAVCAGIDAKSARDSRLGGILPVSIKGTTETASLAEIDSALETPKEPFPVADAKALPGTGSAPFGASGPAGLGRVLFLGFDPLMRPVSDWQGLPRFWRVQLPLAPNPAADAVLPEQERERRMAMYDAQKTAREFHDRFVSQEQRRIDEVAQLALTGKSIALGWFFALLVGYLLVIGPIDYFVLKALRKQAWTWVTLPLAIIAFCAAAWGMSARTRARDAHIVAVGTIDAWPDATRENSLLLVVAPLPGEQDIATASPDARLWPAREPERDEMEREAPDPEVAWGAKPSVRRMAVQGWKPFPVTATTDLPGGTFFVKVEGGRRIVHSPVTLRGCWLEAGAAPKELGDLKDGDAIPEEMGAKQPWEPQSFEAAAEEWFRTSVDLAHRGLLRDVAGTAAHPILCGWIERPASAPLIGSDPPARALFLVRIHLETAP